MADSSHKSQAARENAPRLTSIDAYRGVVMLLMLAEVMRVSAVARALPDSAAWQFLGRQQSHAEWVGCTLHDLIQPSFTFLVGVALPFSLAARAKFGQSVGWTAAHVFARVAALVLLGIFLRSLGKPQTNYTFEDTLTQIGLGYGFLYLIAQTALRWQVFALVLILGWYFALFAAYPVPANYPDPAVHGVPADWPHLVTGWESHWTKNGNAAWAFDAWFLNLFPRETPFRFNGGGYSTLSFVPTLGTMILGLFAGTILTATRPAVQKLGLLAAIGVAILAAGWGLGAAGVCPVVKRIWTPSWVLFSGGWSFLILAAFYAATDAVGVRRVAYPLVVVGANSIAAYLMEWLFAGLVRDALQRHLGYAPFRVFGVESAPLLQGGAILLVFWVILWGMYRRRWFLKL